MTADVQILVLLRQLRSGPEREAAGAAAAGGGAGPILGPCERAALAAALAMREAAGGRVTAMSLGRPGGEDRALALALAAGCDAAVHVEHANAEALDYLGVAMCLVRAARRAPGPGGGWQIVLSGERSLDERRGAVGPAVAELLGIPHVSAVTALALAPPAPPVHEPDTDESAREGVREADSGQGAGEADTDEGAGEADSGGVADAAPVQEANSGDAADAAGRERPEDRAVICSCRSDGAVRRVRVGLPALLCVASADRGLFQGAAEAARVDGAADVERASAPTPDELAALTGSIRRVAVTELGIDPAELALREQLSGAVHPASARRRAAVADSPSALIARLIEERLLG